MTAESTAQLPGMPTWGEGWLASYVAASGSDDVLRGDYGRGARWWHRLFEGVATLSEGHLAALQERVSRQAIELGTAFRLPGENRERPWPLSAIPLLIGEDEWQGIAAGVAQRAELHEMLLADIYGPQQLVTKGALPAALVTGSRNFWRQMIGLEPSGGYRLHIYAADLGRGPDGEWRVLADHSRAPAGAGYALENRLAASRVMGSLHARLNVQRLAPFFSALREGLGAVCRRAEPRIGLLTPGRYNQSYAEQAHLARYLGLLLVEGEDLAVRDDRLYVRTIEGLKRVDALWRRMDSRFIDPLAFDANSAIGVPGLMDAMAAGNVVIANAPGVGVIEATAMNAFLPVLARRLLGRDLLLPNIATWWCGQDGPRAEVEAHFDRLLIAPAFQDAPAGLPDGRAVLGGSLDPAARSRLVEAMRVRPQDYVAQEVVRLSTMPATADGQLVPRPFTLRVFAARDAEGKWQIMPGGFARLADDSDVRAMVMGEGAYSADVCIVSHQPVEQLSLLPTHVPIRRNPGTLPSRAADNLYWFGRYLERGEGTLRLVRATLGGSIEHGSAALVAGTLDRLARLLIASGASGGGDGARAAEASPADLVALSHAALDGSGLGSVRTLLGIAHGIAEGTRDRLSAEVWRLIDAPLPAMPAADAGMLLEIATSLQERFSALAGLAAENMGRTAGWRFQDLGRRVERAILVCRLLRGFAHNQASVDDLNTLLDLTDSQISYRARYHTGLALVPVRDLVALDPFNPRSVAYQVQRVRDHLGQLPSLRDDGMDEDQQRLATELGAVIDTARAESLGPETVLTIENRLLALSDAIGRRFFLQGSEVIRAAGMTLA